MHFYLFLQAFVVSVKDRWFKRSVCSCFILYSCFLCVLQECDLQRSRDFPGARHFPRRHLETSDWKDCHQRIPSEAFSYLSNLEFLWMSFNVLSSLNSDSFRGLYSLEELRPRWKFAHFFSVGIPHGHAQSEATRYTQQPAVLSTIWGCSLHEKSNLPGFIQQ